METNHSARLVPTWNSNAGAWTEAVRSQSIPSRLITDAAVVEAALDGLPPAGRVLDVGCGEGWLARALTALGAEVRGFDASEDLILRAREFEGATFEVTTYDAFEENAEVHGGPFDAIVFNFSLLSDNVRRTLGAAAVRLETGGRIIVQTAHPFVESKGAYADGWRIETFRHIGDGFVPMPWYYRTVASWARTLHGAGLHITAVLEPQDPDSDGPASLILVAEAG